MSSKFDQSFIDNLQNFTNSLESIVELLKQQSDKGDILNKMAASMDGEKMNDITKDIKEILDISKNTNNNTKKILDEIKSSRKQKETGLFGKIQDKDNKNKIVDGVKVIMLIAGGVLAIGMAFKMIGKIDFLSVIALSAGIYLVSKSFAEIANIKGLTPKKMLLVGLSIVIMATAITISSMILQNFQPIDSKKMLSLVLVSAALGIGSYFIFKAAHNIKVMDLPKYLMLPLLLPLIAMGISKSSEYLKDTQPVGFSQGISAIFVGVILAVGALSVMFLLKSLGNVSIAKVLLATAMIPLIAGGIVLASMILQGFEPIKNPLKILLGSVVMGVALLAFAPAIWLLGKMKMSDLLLGVVVVPLVAYSIVLASNIFQDYQKLKDPWEIVLSSLSMGVALLAFTPTIWLLGKMPISDLLLGALAIPVVSISIVAASWILSLGKYDGNYPGVMWSLGVGLSMISFSIPMVVLGTIAMTGIGALAIIAGAAMIMVVSAAIVASSIILDGGKFNGNYPSVGWAIGTGISLLAFGTSMALLGVIPFAGMILERGGELIQSVATSIRDVSFILAGGNYTGGPTKEWAEGIGLSIGAFAYALSISTQGNVFNKEIDPNLFGNFMVSVANSMIKVADVLKGGDWSGSYPSKEWGEGVSTSLMPFISAYQAINERKTFLGGLFGGEDNDSFTSLMVGIAQSMVSVSRVLKGGSFTGGPTEEWAKNVSTALSSFTTGIGNLDEDKVEIIEDFADAIEKLAKSINNLNTSGLEKLNKLTTSVTIISVIDDKKLQDVLRVMDDNKDKISNVIQQGNGNYTPTSAGRQQVTSVTSTKTLNNNNDPQQQMLSKFDTVIEKFDELLEYVIESKSGENVNTKDKVK